MYVYILGLKPVQCLSPPYSYYFSAVIIRWAMTHALRLSIPHIVDVGILLLPNDVR